MFKALLASAFILGAVASPPAQAQSYSTDQWAAFLETVVGARNCGLVSKSQAIDAMVAEAVLQFGSPMTVPKAYRDAGLVGSYKGKQEANDPAFCDGFTPQTMNSIRMLSADGDDYLTAHGVTN